MQLCVRAENVHILDVCEGQCVGDLRAFVCEAENLPSADVSVCVFKSIFSAFCLSVIDFIPFKCSLIYPLSTHKHNLSILLFYYNHILVFTSQCSNTRFYRQSKILCPVKSIFLPFHLCILIPFLSKHKLIYSLSTYKCHSVNSCFISQHFIRTFGDQTGNFSP